ncbi:hypothetical protein CJ030_MR7G022906 [Morella rubra]|uniref:Uncharacterized protein n=1 Tax=Morella rubra TaxID=262757 RepID=A0A6A1V4D0_9ROSI|nr:hypothetical protein CJ030_MR7G022906 [Morella rubra]
MSGVKRARTTRTGTGSSSQEQEVADPMMTLERRMEYLRGRPVAKERPVTLSDFDQLLYEEHSLYQLFEYQGFLHQLSWTEGFCVDTVVQDFFCALVSVDRAPEVQLEVRGVQFLFSADVIADFLTAPARDPLLPGGTPDDEQRTSGFVDADDWEDLCSELIPPSAVHESSVHALTGSADADRFSLYMFELIMDEAWGIKEYSLPYGVFLTQFLISRGVVIAASDTRKEVKSALNKFTLSRSGAGGGIDSTVRS